MAKSPYISSAIARQFVLFIASIILLALLGSAFLQYEREKQIASNKLAEKGHSIGRLLSSMSVDPMLVYDNHTINEFARNASQQSGVVYAVYLDNEKHALTSYFNQDLPSVTQAMQAAQLKNDPYSTLNILLQQDDILHQTFPVMFNQQQLAEIYIGLDKTPLLTEPQNNLRIHLVSSLLIGLFTGLGIYLGFIKKVSRPVRRLREAANHIIRFNFDKPVEIKVKGKNELTELAQTFEQMRIRLRDAVESRDQSLQEVEELNVSLEDRVRERTNALQELNAQITHQAMHDPLTGLPNRVLVIERLNQAIDYARRHQTGLAVLILDLNNFKEINDTLGHPEGDLILEQVATRIPGALRASDTVGRLGGDEFAVVLPEIDEAHAIEVSEKIIHAMQPVFNLSDQTVNINASVGIALYPEHGEEQSTLIRHADVAMYASKRSNRAISVYNPQLDTHTPGRLALMADLQNAIEQNQLALYYQPQIRIKDNRAYGVEVLLRWNHPQQGFIPPEQFIQLAENTGLINQLTDWVIHQSLKQWREWHDSGLTLEMSINISARNLTDLHLPQTLHAAIQQYNVAPQYIKLEITESSIMTNYDVALNLMRHPLLEGLKYAIDDFGTGYSSLNYLKQLPVDEVKIDKSFIFDMSKNNDDTQIVHSIIDLSHNFGHRVVAEGVENNHVLHMLSEMGCDAIQGFLISKPRPHNEIPGLIRRLNKAHK